MSLAVPILMYHQVSPHPAPSFRKYTVTPAALAAQMRWLALAGYQPITLDTLLAARAGQGASLPRRPVVITLDDGFQACGRYAAPILQAHRFTAIFYLVAGLMGGTSRWLRVERGIEAPLLDWAAARQLLAAGFQCGSHTVSHPRLASLQREAYLAELRESRQALEDGLGHAVPHLAYPYGSFNQEVRDAAAEVGYQSACTVEIGLSPTGDDPLALRRVPVLGTDSLVDFICRLKTGRTLRETLRRVMPAPARGRVRRVA